MKDNCAFILAFIFLTVGSASNSMTVAWLGTLVLGVVIAVNHIERTIMRGMTQRLTHPARVNQLLCQWDARDIPFRSVAIRYICLGLCGWGLLTDVSELIDPWISVVGIAAFLEIFLDRRYRKTQRRLIQHKLTAINTIH